MPSTPYVINGKVYLNGTTNPATSNNVVLRNETTNETISTTTNDQGEYVLDLANLLSGYTEGDFFTVTATGGSSQGKLLRFKSICRNDQAQIENLDVRYTI